ncbi:MAG: FecR domain-containing protein [Williamsia sp.]|nr:FecR domain-containing protein [Williamsia sp.]
MQINDQILSLITARLTQTASPQQLEQLERWIEAAPGNRDEYDTYVKIWEASGAPLRAHTFDAAAAWSKMGPLLNKEERRGEPIGSQKPLLRSIRWIAIAASMILLAGTGYYLWTRLSTEHAVATNTHQSVTLPDGSIVTLRKGSAISYAPRFNSAQRVVELEGEAFFQVKHDGGQSFSVLTGRVEVKVTGTSFLVRSGDVREEVMVSSGRVVVTDREKGSQLVLTAGQEALLYNNRLQQVQLTDLNYLAWQTGVLEFHNTPFLKVLEDLERYYKVSISADSKDSVVIQKAIVTVRFKNQPLEQVLDELVLITGLQTRKEGEAVIFYEK